MKDITESGAVTHIFTQDIRFPTHRYHMIVNFTNEPVSELSAPLFADYFANNPLIASLMQCTVTSNKYVFRPEDYYQFSASVTPFYDLTGVTAKMIVKKNSENRIIYEKDMGPVDVVAGQTYNVVLLDGIVGAGAPQESYTVTLRLLSSAGIMIGSGRTTIAVNP